tara:strand:+ start:1515 stop:2267 length:753 start_codon:yes stop_codon:yes gene_type:complete
MLLDKVVIGSTIESAYYALLNDCYFVPNLQHPPMFYRGNIETWPKLNFILGLLSKLISFDNIETIRLVDNQLRIISQNTTYKYNFETCFIFDPTEIQLENDIMTTKPKTFLVFDDFELSTMGKHRFDIEPITGGSNFAREVHFYSSDRVDGASYITDCVVESELTQDQLNSFDYSDTMTRFVVERHLTSVGIYGTFMEYYKSGKPKYRKPKVKHVKRLVYPKDNNVYADTESVKIINLSLEEIVEKSTKG